MVLRLREHTSREWLNLLVTLILNFSLNSISPTLETILICLICSDTTFQSKICFQSWEKGDVKYIMIFFAIIFTINCTT